MAVTINGTTGIVTPDITTDSATVDTTTLVVDETNNRVGIGTSSPSTILHVKGANPNIRIEDNNETASGAIAFYDSVRETGRVSVASGASPSMQFNVLGATRATIDSSGNLKFNSGYGSVATAYGCRAWVNFDGTTATPSIRADGNVSSIGDNGAGDYTINFSTALPDSNYSVTTCGTMRGAGSSELGYLQIRSSSGGTPTTPDVMSTTAIRLYNKPDDATTSWDLPVACVAVFR